jgi:U2 small nuclear ribonucleoprotein A'
MRLTAELINAAPAYINPIKERELSLRGFKIPAIENLGVTKDQYETIDLSDNEIVRVTNFPVLNRLQCLLLNNNRISRIDSNLGEFLPKLTALILSNNKINNLSDLEALADLPHLTHVSFLNNPVAGQSNYRSYVISRLPKLKVLDFTKVKPKEREAAKALFGTVERKKESKNAGEKQDSVMFDAQSPNPANSSQKPLAAAKTFIPGEGINIVQTKGPTPDQKAKILAAINNAKSLQEIERLEKMLNGQIPINI